MKDSHSFTALRSSRGVAHRILEGPSGEAASTRSHRRLRAPPIVPTSTAYSSSRSIQLRSRVSPAPTEAVSRTESSCPSSTASISVQSDSTPIASSTSASSSNPSSCFCRHLGRQKTTCMTEQAAGLQRLFKTRNRRAARPVRTRPERLQWLRERRLQRTQAARAGSRFLRGSNRRYGAAARAADRCVDTLAEGCPGTYRDDDRLGAVGQTDAVLPTSRRSGKGRPRGDTIDSGLRDGSGARAIRRLSGHALGARGRRMSRATSATNRHPHRHRRRVVRRGQRGHGYRFKWLARVSGERVAGP